MTDTITSSFTQRYLPWMKIGTVIDEESVDSARAAALGGIDFNVELRNAAYWRPELDENGIDNGDGEWVEEPSRRAIVREDTGEWFSFVSTDYRPVQFHETFSFLDEINPNYVAAGALSNGRKGFMIVQLPEHMHSAIEINGIADPHDLYVVVQTSHDLSRGSSHDLSRGCNIAVVMLRNKCMNMLTLPSFTADAPQSWSIPHIGDPHAKLKQAQQTLTNASRYQENFERQVQQYASVHVTSDDVRQIARRVLPKRLKTIDEQVDLIVQRFESGETVGFPGTGWAAVNAVSDYLQWGRSTATRTNQSEFTSPLEGDTAKYVNRTAQLIMQRA